MHTTSQPCDSTILDSPVLFLVERLDNCHTPQNTILVWISIWFDRKSLIFRMKAQSEQRVGSDEGGGQGRCRWWRVVSWSCPQVIWTVRRHRKQQQRCPSADLQRCSDRSFCTILYHLPSVSHRLRPSVTLVERSVCRYTPEACAIVGGRWVPADASNSRGPAPLLGEAQPRSGDKAGCNSQVAVDPALL